MNASIEAWRAVAQRAQSIRCKVITLAAGSAPVPTSLLLELTELELDAIAERRAIHLPGLSHPKAPEQDA